MRSGTKFYFSGVLVCGLGVRGNGLCYLRFASISMKAQKFLSLAALLVSACVWCNRAVAEDSPGTQPHFLFTRMSGYDVSGMDKKKFGRYVFTTSRNAETGEVTRKPVDGAYLQVSYLWQAGLDPNSTVFVARNHENALKALGAEVLYKDESEAEVALLVFKVVKDGKTVWGELDLTAGGNDFRITSVTEGEMEQEITAQLIESTVRATGRFVVYGIQFDTNKSTIRPESAEATTQIAEMLRSSGI